MLIMKKCLRLISALLGVGLLFASCEQLDPPLFDEGASGAYFDYSYAADFERNLNFADYIVGDPDTVAITLKVKLLGYLSDKQRALAIKTREVEDYALADVIIDHVVFAQQEYEKDVEVRVVRPRTEDSIFAVCIYLDGSGDIGTGISGKDKVTLYVTHSYVKPEVWYSHMETYLGGWNREKHRFLAKHTNDNHFYDRLYDADQGTHLFDAIVGLNVSAVNTLLAQQPEEPIVVDLPILAETDYPAYTEPYFWNMCEPYLGRFRASKFCRFTKLLGGSNTRDIAARYNSEEGRTMMEEQATEFHKLDVLEMLNEYYRYAQQGYTIADYDTQCWNEMRSNVTYTMRIPFWWEDPLGLGTAPIVKKYFGEYTADKYQFMLKTMMEVDGTATFIAASLLPFTHDSATGSYGWDPTPIGTDQLAGEERLKECYRIIKAKNDKRPDTRKYDIPEVEL